MTINLNDLKRLRIDTAASVSDCRQALEDSKGDYKKALTWLTVRAKAIAEKKAERVTGQGIIDSYLHAGGKVGVLIELLCETDFVARTDEFKNLAKEIGMQVAAMKPENVIALLKQEYIRDQSMTIADLLKSTIGKLGENITIKRFQRFEVGE
jgi:elongation factor Ts